MSQQLQILLDLAFLQQIELAPVRHRRPEVGHQEAMSLFVHDPYVSLRD